MLVNIRQLPGMRVPTEYRVEISSAPGERPIVPPTIRGVEALRDFLTKRLGQPRIVANRLISQIEAQPFSAHCLEDVRLDPQAVTTIVRQMDREETARLDALT